MKVAILAGGYGSRLAELTDLIPKPMVSIGGNPILWHIMKYYSQFDFNDFVIALGYKGEVIKRYMVDYFQLGNNLHINIGTGQVQNRLIITNALATNKQHGNRGISSRLGNVSTNGGSIGGTRIEGNRAHFGPFIDT